MGLEWDKQNGNLIPATSSWVPQTKEISQSLDLPICNMGMRKPTSQTYCENEMRYHLQSRPSLKMISLPLFPWDPYCVDTGKWISPSTSQRSVVECLRWPRCSGTAQWRVRQAGWRRWTSVDHGSTKQNGLLMLEKPNNAFGSDQTRMNEEGRTRSWCYSNWAVLLLRSLLKHWHPEPLTALLSTAPILVPSLDTTRECRR